ncbi:MAG: UbiA prenyltransferase family protein [Patescibacteria group bacterium]|nr:UbiA prenyltransferase family protein [Patescibacteria group bacterium]
MIKKRLIIYFYALRANQWIKNLAVFTAIIFSGKLFNRLVFINTLNAFFVFCLLSSASYLLNDIIDYPYDKKHPIKKNRPIASGKISLAEASFMAFILIIISLVISLFFSTNFFLLSLVFILLHFFYSFYFKKYPVIDIFTISFSFMIRALAGEVVSGYHIPIWLILTIFFGSLFMASVKRHAELVSSGKEARLSLYRYNEHFLDFLTYTFATMTIIAYSFYTYFEKPPLIETWLSQYFSHSFSGFEGRKWLMMTIPLVVYGISRYAQLLYEKYEGEIPEKIVTTDKPLIITVFLWGAIVIGLIYVF